MGRIDHQIIKVGITISNGKLTKQNFVCELKNSRSLGSPRYFSTSTAVWYLCHLPTHLKFARFIHPQTPLKFDWMDSILIKSSARRQLEIGLHNIWSCSSQDYSVPEVPIRLCLIIFLASWLWINISSVTMVTMPSNTCSLICNTSIKCFDTWSRDMTWIGPTLFNSINISLLFIRIT